MSQRQNAALRPEVGVYSFRKYRITRINWRHLRRIFEDLTGANVRKVGVVFCSRTGHLELVKVSKWTRATTGKCLGPCKDSAQ